MNCLPRDVLLWVNNLNLTYKVRNVKRDLCNGFVPAEIVSRYLPKDNIDMHSFGTGMGMVNKLSNWDYLKRVVNAYNAKNPDFTLTIDDKEINDIVNGIQNSAFNFLMKLYSQLTKKKLEDVTPPEVKEDPNAKGYERQTIAVKMKETDLHLILDKKTQAEEAQKRIKDHDQKVRDEKKDAVTFYKTRIMSKATPIKTHLAHIQSKIQNDTVKEIKLKANTLKKKQGLVRSRRELALQNYEEDDKSISIRQCLRDIVRPGIGKLPCSHEEYKSMKASTDIVDFFITKLKKLDKPVVKEILTDIKERTGEVVGALSKSMYDIGYYMNFISELFRKLKTVGKKFAMMADHVSAVGNGLVNTDPELSETCIIEYGLSPLMQLFKEFPDKCTTLVYLLYCFIPPTINSHCRLIQAMKDKMGEDLNSYVFACSRLIEVETCELSDAELYDTYYGMGIKLLSSSHPNARLHSIAILAKLAGIDYIPMVSLLPVLKDLSTDYVWEIKAQIIILCSNLLENMNSHPPTTEEEKKEEEGIDIPKIVALVFDIIKKCFNNESPHLTKKVGLLYLSKILKYYIDFNQHYLSILLQVSPEIRNAVLSNTPLEGTQEVEYYTKSSYSLKYQTSGATLSWCPIYIAHNLQNVILNSKIDSLDLVHIQVFSGCLIQGFQAEDISKWEEIFQSLKEYFFLAICEKELANISVNILKKYLNDPKMQLHTLEACKTVFVKTLDLIYNGETDPECQEIMRAFLEYLHDNDQQGALKEMVYFVIKSFASQHKEAYQNSNLIELMNRVVEEKRGEIFKPE